MTEVGRGDQCADQEPFAVFLYNGFGLALLGLALACDYSGRHGLVTVLEC